MDITGATIAITGAAGSIGSALVKHLVGIGAKAIRAIDSNETGLHHLGRRHPEIRLLLGDVRDRERMRQAMSGADIVFHAAALKHVTLGEYNAADLVATNVLGTVNVAHACHEQGVKRLVLISTDKAAEPTSAMGASKMLAERVVADINLWSPCHGVAVRFGNVFGSRGSVVPTLLRQIAREHVATITDPEATRFTLPIDKAVALVVRAGTSDLPRGAIVVLPMPAYRLDDLGFAVVAMWNETHPKDEVKATLASSKLGVGEKQHEILLSGNDLLNATAQGDWIVVGQTKGAGLPSHMVQALNSLHAQRVERFQLVKWVKEYMAERMSEVWE